MAGDPSIAELNCGGHEIHVYIMHQESGILLKCTYVDLNFLKSLKSSEIQ